MKTIGSVFLFAAIAVFFTTAVTAQGTGCSGGKRAEGVYYTDCYPWISGDGLLPDGTTPNARARLQRAIDGSTGKLVFNEDNYYIGGTLNLHSFATLEGLSTVANTTPSGVRLIQTQDNTSVFFIGSDIHDIAIRNMGFYYFRIGASNPIVPTDATAIKAEAANSTTLHSTFFQFDHLRIAHFTRGIYVNSTGDGGWQFDNNHLQDASFEDCLYGIHLNSLNTGWQMNNIVFASNENQNGLKIEKAGYVNINLMVGNGTRDGNGVGIAGEFIKILEHGFVNIQNANGEAYKKTLIIDTPNSVKGTPVILSNSDFQECHWVDGGVTKPSVVFTNATVVSQGNSYACLDKVARPSVEGMAEVSSSGDRFCYEGHAECFSTSSPFLESSRSGWAIKGWHALVRTDNISDSNGTVYDLKKAFVDITSTYSYDAENPVYKPLLSLTNSYYDAGYSPYYFKWRYTFTRNASNGRLEMEGDLNGAPVAPSVGYHFKGGPVQLWRVTASDISAGYYNLSANDKGSMLYCSDCTAGTNPCSTTGAGGGALAVRIESGNWACK